jgi:hypothetical protein
VAREPVGVHEVHPGEELVRRVDPVQLLAWDVHEEGEAGPGRNVDRIVREELIDGDALPHEVVQPEVHPEGEDR